MVNYQQQLAEVANKGGAFKVFVSRRSKGRYERITWLNYFAFNEKIMCNAHMSYHVYLAYMHKIDKLLWLA